MKRSQLVTVSLSLQDIADKFKIKGSEVQVALSSTDESGPLNITDEIVFTFESVSGARGPKKGAKKAKKDKNGTASDAIVEAVQ